MGDSVIANDVDAHGWGLLIDLRGCAGDPTHALFSGQSQSIRDNVMALSGAIRAWDCSAANWACTGRISAMWNRIPIERCPGQVGVCCALPSDTRGRSRVPELGSLGSVRGALRNGGPYREHIEQRQEMTAEDQARSQCNDHYGDVVPLAPSIGPAIKQNRYCETERHAPKAAFVAMIPTIRQPPVCDFHDRVADAPTASTALKSHASELFKERSFVAQV